MSLYRDEGVVLRTSKLGEADRIITILTRGHGKIRAVAVRLWRTSHQITLWCQARAVHASRCAYR